MPLFEVVVIEKPTKKQEEEGEIEKLVYGPKAVVARNAQAAALLAMSGDELPEETDLNRVDVLVRPFSL